MAMRPSTKMQLAKMAREEARQPGRKMEIEYETWGNPEQRADGDMEMRRGGRVRRSARSEMDMAGGGGARSDWDNDMDMEMRRGDGGRGNRGGGNRRGARSEMDMEMGGYEADSRFRDRRGREHYDNGRFAPMRGNYAPYGPYGADDGPFGRYERGGDDMRPIGFNSNWGGEMRMGSDASVPRYNEMDRMPGNRAMMGGYMADRGRYPKMDERTAMEWVKSMTAADGTPMPHWTMEQVKQVAKQKGLHDMEIPELFAILNALYSGYDPIFKRHGVSKMDFYVEMAEAWLQDEDAVENKAMAYRECVVKR